MIAKTYPEAQAYVIIKEMLGFPSSDVTLSMDRQEEPSMQARPFTYGPLSVKGSACIATGVTIRIQRRRPAFAKTQSTTPPPTQCRAQVTVKW